jgi:hypothetical protein
MTETSHPQWAIKRIHRSKISAVKIVNWQDHHEIATIPYVYDDPNGELDRLGNHGATIANLIVSAPELLAALENLCNSIDDNDPALHHGAIGWKFVREARAAIAKAKGL